MSQKWITIVGFAVALAIWTIASDTVHASAPFARDGEIHRIDAYERVIVVNDVAYVLPPDVQVYLYNARARRSDGQYKGQKIGNGAALREGMYIGFNVNGEGPQRVGRIAEVWLLPPNSLKALSK